MTLRIFHVITEVDEGKKQGTCGACATRVLVYFKEGKWRCQLRPAKEKKYSGKGRPLQHQLTDVDTTNLTGVCSLCGPVRVYDSKGKRARQGQVWVCGRRPAERKVGGMTLHRLTNINEKAKRADCALCGPTAIIWRPYENGGGRWGCIISRQSLNRSAYKVTADYVPVICPYCNKNHRWHRGPGMQCRDRFIVEHGNHCAICKCEFTKDNAARIDHDHKTGKTRGTLCRTCNVALGLLRDDAALLKNAIAYLSS